MPIKAGELDKELQYLKNKLPQLGFFSTLDELIRNAPQEQMPAEQWANYLKPGQTLTRAGVNFPLKAEELQYSQLPEFLKTMSPGGNPEWRSNLLGFHEGLTEGPIPKNVLLDILHANRPEFNVVQYGHGPEMEMHPRIAMEEGLHYDPDDPGIAQAYHGKPRYAEYAHQAGVPQSYEESITTSPDFGQFQSHFTPRDLSWSRTTRHYLDPENIQYSSSPTARLIEEIQSDRHEAAAEKVLPTDHGNTVPAAEFSPEAQQQATRRGYRTPQDEAILQGLMNRSGYGDPSLFEIGRKPPDTPFKGPGDYGLLELKKQLLNSVNAGDQYLALVRPQDQIARYGLDPDKAAGMQHVYGNVYPAALEKLARQYGAPVENLPLSVKASEEDIRSILPPTLQNWAADDPHELLARTDSDGDYVSRARELLHDYSTLVDWDRAGEVAHRRARDILNRLEPNVNPRGDEDYTGIDISDKGALEQQLHTLHQLWMRDVPTEFSSDTKTFPAMKITPEVAEKVRQAGVPIWALAGATAGAGALEGLGDNGDIMNQAKGGSVEFDHIGHAIQRMGFSLPPENMPVERETMAEGGDVESNPTPDYSSSLVKLKNFLQNHLGEIPARAGTSFARQFYGTDKDGHLVLGGRAWTSGQGGTPMQLLDSVTAIPHHVADLVNLAEKLGTGATGKFLGMDPRLTEAITPRVDSPDWSDAAASRAADLKALADRTLSFPKAHTLAQHIADNADIVSPVPGLPEEGMASHIIGALGGSSLKNLPRMTAEWAGVNGALDTILDRLSPEQAVRHAATRVDPDFEQAALDYTNQGMADGGQPDPSEVQPSPNEDSLLSDMLQRRIIRGIPYDDGGAVKGDFWSQVRNRLHALQTATQGRPSTDEELPPADMAPADAPNALDPATLKGILQSLGNRPTLGDIQIMQKAANGYGEGGEVSVGEKLAALLQRILGTSTEQPVKASVPIADNTDRDLSILKDFASNPVNPVAKHPVYAGVGLNDADYNDLIGAEAQPVHSENISKLLGQAGGGEVTRRALLKLLGAVGTGAAAVNLAKLGEREASKIGESPATAALSKEAAPMQAPEGLEKEIPGLVRTATSVKIPQDALLKHLEDHALRLEPDGLVDPELIGTPDAYMNLPNLEEVQAANGPMASFLKSNGLFHDTETGHFHYDPSKRPLIEREAKAIVADYDQDDDELAKLGYPEGTTHPWEKYGLGGDDDVDYNGGHVLSTLDALDDFLQNNGKRPMGVEEAPAEMEPHPRATELDLRNARTLRDAANRLEEIAPPNEGGIPWRTIKTREPDAAKLIQKLGYEPDDYIPDDLHGMADYESTIKHEGDD